MFEMPIKFVSKKSCSQSCLKFCIELFSNQNYAPPFNSNAMNVMTLSNNTE